MNKLLRSFLILLLLAEVSQAQVSRQSGGTATRPEIFRESRPSGNPANGASKATPQEFNVPGGTDMGLVNVFPYQTTGRGLHTIQVDPSNQRRIHAVMMVDPSTEEADTVDLGFPGRRVLYMYSGDGGATWGEPVTLTTTRAGYPDMILYKKGNDYLPLIACHRRDLEADEYRSSLFIGTGSPGSGQFNEVSANRTHADGEDYDIIWPAIAVSPDYTTVYMVASVIREATADPFRRFQFSTFTLNAGDASATWNGPWKNGPGDDLSGLESGGDFVVRTSASGKVGILWIAEEDANYDVYFSESTNGGIDWSSTTFPIYERVGVESANSSLLTPVDGLDFFYDGETAQAIWSAYALLDDGSNSYYPSLGALMHWRQGMAVPTILVSREGFVSDLDDALYPLGDLGFFGGETSTEPQGANISGATIAQTQNPKKFSIFFNTWMEGDTSEVFEYNTRGEDAAESYVFQSVHRITTLDGGETWDEPVLIHGNTEPRLDYRNVSVSTWNPYENGNNVAYKTMFNVDTMAGIFLVGGTPTFSSMRYFFESFQVAVGSVKQIGTSDNMTLGQNYPNPFNPSTSISFTLKNATKVTLTVEDMMGRTVATVFDGFASAGSTPVKFDASNLSAGVYQYVLKSENESVARRMVLTK